MEAEGWTATEIAIRREALIAGDGDEKPRAADPLREFTPRERAMLEYAQKLTVHPAKMNAADVDRLRAVGFDDRAIHDICAITAYFAFVNRMADGLGVELE